MVTDFVDWLAKRKYQTYIGRARTHCTHVPEALETHVWQDANRRGTMKSGWIHAAGGGVYDSQERLWCLAIFRSLFLVGQQQLKPDKHMHKHTSVRMNACTHTASHLHGTQWCWECDVHLDSSVRKLVLLSPHQSYSASPAVQETKPEEEDREKRECEIN